MSARARLSMWPPAWAQVFGEDRFGVFASFELDGVEFVWRWIPPGSFMMGSPEGEKGRFENEGPQHAVRISQGFWLGDAPVTQAQYRVVTGGDPSEFKGAERPVEQVSWDQAGTFCTALEGKVPGLAAGLPSEAQWEYACRAETNAAFNDGSDCTEPLGLDPALAKLGWFDDNSGKETQPVKGKLPNAWGLFDMHGSVWEWCRDGNRDYAVPWPGADPLGPHPNESGVAEEDRVARVVRGGSWVGAARGCRSACRGWLTPGGRVVGLGFRVLAGRAQAQPPEAESGASGAS